MWGDEAAERHEMDEPSDPLAVDGTPRLLIGKGEAIDAEPMGPNQAVYSMLRKPCDHENFTTEPNHQGNGVCRDCGTVL